MPSSAPWQPAPAAAGPPWSSWTKCIASTRRSRTHSCRMSNRGCSSSSVRPRNPRPFEVVGALLSRAAVYVLEPLNADELEDAMARAPPPDRSGGLAIEPVARRMLIDLADGDARRLLNALEVASTAARDRARRPSMPLSLRSGHCLQPCGASTKAVKISMTRFLPAWTASRCVARTRTRDVELYWMTGAHARRRCRSPLYRPTRRAHGGSRISVLPTPRGLEIALAAAATFRERLAGSPEGELAIAQAIVASGGCAEVQRRLRRLQRRAGVREQHGWSYDRYPRGPRRMRQRA